ncbi:hypothetical protein HHI36_013517 [Cryptolaemus montrouzieri]|uniref:Sm domain-containing protein n=1 Tax=Cryptolaemus montrouzieri TaxID=559131 RepID=A0ABD2NHK7_9CUCU
MIWTRNAHTVRGYCIAYVTAFDKHWNLALREVTEVWTRPKKRKTVSLLDADRNSTFQTQRKIRPPPITILKVTKSQEVCSRKVDQYIVRGEHVVLITIFREEN